MENIDFNIHNHNKLIGEYIKLKTKNIEQEKLLKDLAEKLNMAETILNKRESYREALEMGIFQAERHDGVNATRIIYNLKDVLNAISKEAEKSLEEKYVHKELFKI